MKKIFEVIIILTIFISGAFAILVSGAGVTTQEKTALFMESFSAGKPASIAEWASESEDADRY